ncbi:MAG: ABC transporter ATP-binding protein [Candidatus Sumerlaeota bacterium]
MSDLSAQSLSLTFGNGVQALRDVSFDIEQSSFVSLLGPSGCGKSTLLRIIAGLIAPTSGTLGGDAGSAAHRNELSFVFQSPALLPWRTVTQNVQLPLELARVEDAVSQRVMEMIELVGLREFAGAYPHELSGGMQMRTSLARALVTKPRLLLLDEPFGALDDITRQRLNEELLALWGRDKFTAIFVTHNVSEAVFLSQRVMVMSPRPGRIHETFGIPFEYPRDRELRATAPFAQLSGMLSNSIHDGHERAAVVKK